MTKLKEADRKVITYMLETFFNMLHHREGIQTLNSPEGVEVKEKDPDSTEMTTSYAEYDLMAHRTSPRHVITSEHILSSKWAMTLLSWYVASVASLALVVFWVQFVVEQITNTVEGNADCYIAMSDGSYELVNFSDTELTFQEVKVDVCYALGLDFPKAIAEVAGILFLASNGFAFLTFLMLLVVDGIEIRMYRIMLYLALGTVEYGAVGLILYAFGVRNRLRGEEDSINLIIEEYLIGFALIMGTTTHWLLLFWATKRWARKRGRAIFKKSEEAASVDTSVDPLRESTAL